ncbi:PH domain-containing protein [Actinophytocola glycyrrhizae]|uniref:PH domain-containing protein n=1 Tax=Actinophytocola glycyrrhizae TaxID=2044873 RepID=A0ABV9SD76_9PSEU
MTVPQLPSRLVFRIPSTAVLGALLFAVTATPFAWAAPGLYLVYVVPVVAIVWVLRVRTTADGEKLVARTLFGRHVLPWTDVRALKLSERSWVRAVDEAGKELPLPNVRTRHLPALSLISGGRLDDPTEAPEQTPEEESGEPREEAKAE